MLDPTDLVSGDGGKWNARSRPAVRREAFRRKPSFATADRHGDSMSQHVEERKGKIDCRVMSRTWLRRRPATSSISRHRSSDPRAFCLADLETKLGIGLGKVVVARAQRAVTGGKTHPFDAPANLERINTDASQIHDLSVILTCDDCDRAHSGTSLQRRICDLKGH